MAWVKRIKIVDADELTSKMNKIMQSWDETGVDNVAYAFTELAQEIGLPPDTVLTQGQVKRLKDKGIL